MKKYFIIFILSSISSFSQTLYKGWNTLSGKIENYSITISIFNDENGNLSGNYCYKNKEQRISIRGTKKDTIINLEEIIDNKINAVFNGIINEKQNSISGKWINSSNQKELNFEIKLLSQSGINFINRYNLGTSNEEVENFIKKVKSSILNEDKSWISNNIKYPISVNINSKKIKIKSSKDFLRNYSKIINDKFKIKIKKSCSCDIFSNWQGAMFADGLVWINDIDDTLKIISINN